MTTTDLKEFAAAMDRARVTAEQKRDLAKELLNLTVTEKVLFVDSMAETLIEKANGGTA